jgi:hypothetical protein
MIKVKTGVQPKHLVIAAALANVSEILKLELTITSGTDGKHMPGSKHYTGEALDIRTSNLTRTNRERVLVALKGRLGPQYDVVLEKDHIHVEYDPS